MLFRSDVLRVRGGGERFPQAAAELWVGNSGTTIRFLTAMLTVGQGRYRLDGVPRMRQRPIADLIDALRQLGADVVSESNNGCPPVIVHARGLHGGTAHVRASISSQFLSGLLMAAPYAQHDVELCVKYKVPVIITSLGAREDVNQAIHSYGGVVLHDIINNRFAHKAIEKGADGLIAVAAGAGGHAGVKSPFALIQEIRAWFDGPIALSGSIATGDAILAAQAMGADFAYIGSAFIATQEARAAEAYKQCIVQSTSDDIVYSNLFTGVHGNYLAPSIRNAGLDPDNLPVSDPSQMNFGSDRKAWKDI